MMLRIFIQVLIIFLVIHANAQDSTVQPKSRHIIILNKKHEPFKEINIGDKIRLKLTNSMKVKGHITSIDSTSFTVETSIVHLNEIEKISTKKIWVQGVVGGVLLAGGFVSFASYVDNYCLGNCDDDKAG